MRKRCIRIKTMILHFIYAVNAIREDLFLDIFQFVACHYCLKFDAELIGKRATFGEEFKADIGHLAILVFAINYQVVIILHDCRILEPAV